VNSFPYEHGGGQAVDITPFEGSVASIAEVIEEGQIIFIDNSRSHGSPFPFGFTIFRGSRKGEFSSHIVEGDGSLGFPPSSPLGKLETKRPESATVIREFQKRDIGIPIPPKEHVNKAQCSTFQAGPVNAGTLSFKKPGSGFPTVVKKPEPDLIS
jgi:hypothetical protein